MNIKLSSGILVPGIIATVIFSYSAGSLAAKPETDKQKFSYAIGYQIGQGLKRDGLTVDTDTLSEAIRDVMNDKPSQLSIAEMRDAVLKQQQIMEAERNAKADTARQEGEAFLATNKQKAGIITLESGLQYKVIESGSGKQPGATDSITAHYHGTLLNGKVFDSSYDRNQPATFNVNQVIKGWQEVLQLMHEGDKWQVFIPSDLGYGTNGAGSDIGPNETLVFDIELISVND